MSRVVEPGRHHPVRKLWRRVGGGRERDLFFLEHRSAVMEALGGPHPPEQVLLADSVYRDRVEFWEGLAEQHSGVRFYRLSDASLAEVTSVPSCSGLCAVVRAQPRPWQELLDGSFVTVLWEVQDPGNVGTLLRSALALTSGGVIQVGGCWAWSSKVARSSAGALLEVPLGRLEVDQARALWDGLEAAGYRLYAAEGRAATPLQEVAWGARCALLLGNESRGLPERGWGSENAFRIPLSSRVESLNVAIAGTLAMWEWNRSSGAHRSADRP